MIMKTNKEIKQELDNMKGLPMFEINLSDYIETLEEEEHTYCYINYNEQTNMLQYGGCSNSGFICRYEIEYDKDYSIDYNLEGLLELFIENSINEYNNEN